MGEPEEVNIEVLQAIVRADMVAVIAPIGVGGLALALGARLGAARRSCRTDPDSWLR